MTIEEAIEYAHQQMRDMGIKIGEYHFEPVKVYPTEDELDEGRFKIRAYNELYILVYPERNFGIFIIADNSAYSTEFPLDCGVPEFTGTIHISMIDPDDGWSFTRGSLIKDTVTTPYMEFLRVVY